jgi:hypothetical protein
MYCQVCKETIDGKPGDRHCGAPLAADSPLNAAEVDKHVVSHKRSPVGGSSGAPKGSAEGKKPDAVPTASSDGGKLLFEQAFSEHEDLIDRAKAIRSQEPATSEPDALESYDKAMTVLSKASAAKRWDVCLQAIKFVVPAATKLVNDKGVADKKRADAELKAKQKADFEAALRELAPQIRTADEISKLDPCPADDETARAFTAAREALKIAREEGRWSDAPALIGSLRQRCEELAAARDAKAELDVNRDKYKSADRAMLKSASQKSRELLTQAEQAFEVAYKDRKWGLANDLLMAAVGHFKLARESAAAGKAAYAQSRPDTLEAIAIVSKLATLPPGAKAQRDKFDTIRRDYETLGTAQGYADAAELAEELQRLCTDLLEAKRIADEQAKAEHEAAMKEVAPLQATAREIRKDPRPADDGTLASCDSAAGDLHKAQSEGRWSDATGLIPQLKAAIADLVAARDAKADLAPRYEKYKTIDRTALKAAGPQIREQFSLADKDLERAWLEGKWGEAGGHLTAAVLKLKEARLAADAAKKAYEESRPSAQAAIDTIAQVAAWPPEAQAQHEKFETARKAYAAFAAEQEYPKATALVKDLQDLSAALLEAKRVVDQQKAAYEQAYDAVAALHRQGVDLHDATPCPADAATVARWDKAVKTHDAATAGQRWVEARDSLPGLETAAKEMAAANDAMKAFDAEWAGLEALLAEAKAFAGTSQLASLSAWSAAQGRVNGHREAKRWGQARAKAQSLKTACIDLKAEGAAYKALTDDETHADGYTGVRDTEQALTEHTPGDVPKWNAAQTAYLQFRSNKDWINARKQLALADEIGRRLLETTKARADYMLVGTTAAEQKVKAALTAAKASKGLPRIRTEFFAKRSAWVEAFNADKWGEATSTFQQALTVSTQLLESVDYLAAYEGAKEAITNADSACQYPPVGNAPAKKKVDAYAAERTKLDALVQARDFLGAQALLPKLKSAAAEVQTALASANPDAKAAFEKALPPTQVKMETAKAARSSGKASIPALELAWRSCTTAESAMNAAKKSEAWTQARAALAGLDAAADKFNALCGKWTEFETFYTEPMQQVVARAGKLAAEALPQLEAEAKAVADLHGAALSSMATGDFAKAKEQILQLKGLAEALEKKDSALGSKAEAKGMSLRDMLTEAKGLKQRVGEFARGLDDEARQSVIELADACLQGLSAKVPDLAAAQAQLTLARQKFDEVQAEREKTWNEFNVSMRKQIAQALSTAKSLGDALLVLCKTSIKAGLESVDAAASKKHFGSATEKGQLLVDETKTWLECKPAFEALAAKNKYLPQLDDLKALVAKSGGGKVLDSILSARMSDEASIGADRVNVALEARFGVKASRYDKRAGPSPTGNEEDLVAPKTIKFDDKSVLQAYKVMAKVPQQQWTAKLDAMVLYDQNSDDKTVGGHYSERDDKKKVYMYCGRPGEQKQKFGKGQKIVPEGDAVDESCQPSDEKDVELFDFTLLHEAAHAEDHARGYMTKNGGAADHGGWVTHSGPEDFLDKVLSRFDYDKSYILAALQAPAGAPPAPALPVPSTRKPDQWDKAREDFIAWCQSVRESAAPWDDPTLSRAIAIGGRVYQESGAHSWVSYDIAARARGISSYQFRSPGEWFAELYAAYFSKKLKRNHPAASWLKTFKSPAAKV